jgi:glycosyltransferase involved in cell wall biosynthesis
MRILLCSEHRYPIEDGYGVGVTTRTEPSGAPARIHDLLARGLGELGHEVLYLLRDGAGAPLPPGVTLADAIPADADICHNIADRRFPSVFTQHRTRDIENAPENWIFVSQSLAALYGSRRFVRNGLDPADYIYSETKDDYLLFLASMQGNATRHKYLAKGLPIALHLASDLGFKLIVAGTAMDHEILGIVTGMCKEARVEFLGDVRGCRKAELIAGARALLFPTQMHEGLPLVIIEALFSGTPVIASDFGPCPEIVTPEVGFICGSDADYARAIEGVSRIRPRDCRARAIENHHYLAMARKYVAEYEIEACRYGAAAGAADASATHRPPLTDFRLG